MVKSAYPIIFTTTIIQNTQDILDVHFVHPHNVSSYFRDDDTAVSGCWRDGDSDKYQS